ncbi:HlyD family efflux transporter periplasmic adaptor subunit [Rubripirellula amarantea]|nr:HlyD family efflux transporter periplasmic adaptor subunit [Rubripirellula amarantea]
MSNTTVNIVMAAFAMSWLSHADTAAIAQGDIQLKSLSVVAIDTVDVPSMRSGKIASLDVREGDIVQAGQVLGKLDDREAMIAVELAKTELAVAQARTMDHSGIDYAEAKLKADRQQSRQQQILRRIAEQQSENETRIQAARKAEAVSKNELERAIQSRNSYSESVSQSEIEGLRLAFEKSRLETKQAEFEQRVAVLQAQAEVEAAKRFDANVEQSQTEIAAAKSGQDIQRLQSLARKQQLELAQTRLDQHHFTAPFAGTIVERHQHSGGWVNAGDPVMKLIRLDRLRVDGYLALDDLSSIQLGDEVELEVQAGTRTIQRVGEVTFVAPTVDPVNQEVRVWIEFDNQDFSARPGMQANVVGTRKASAAKGTP